MIVATGLDQDQRQSLRAQGFLHLPGVVAPELVRRALRTINNDLSRGIDPARLPIFQAQSFCPDVTATPAITDLMERSGARTLIESATGALKPVGSGQIALRWPRLEDAKGVGKAHIDGTYSPTNGVPAGKILNFTALACVLLSDLPDEFAGNFTLWPGSHLVHERHFREHGPEALLNEPKLDLGVARQITGKAGDVILAHYLLGHTVASNCSPHIRYAVFFRLESTAFNDGNRLGSITDAWRDWAGMRAG
ncbi:MAG: hypothetical protein H0X45_05745 [Planctomycetes bacterium]|nr:hypothetical protein [Planctomycetota bacterium]